MNENISKKPIQSNTKFMVGPTVSIVIRAKNEEKFVGQTLEAIFGQESSHQFEVILLDSGSTDRTLAIVNNFDIRLEKILPKNFSFGRALNRGVELANGFVIVNLSAHCIPTTPKWLDHLVEPILSGISNATFGKQEPIIGLNPFEEQLLQRDFDLKDGEEPIVLFSNSNAAIEKSLLTNFPFDEKVSFAEDFIWAKRLPEQFQIKYVREASVYHSHPLTFRYWTKRYYDNGMAEQYIQNACGFEWPWRPAAQIEDMTLFAKISRLTKSLLLECASIFSFLIKNKYYKYAVMTPLFVLARKFYYRKGWRAGERLDHARATSSLHLKT